MATRTVQQLSLFLENRPGVLADVCRDLAARKINIEALTVADHVDHAVVRMVVDNVSRALHLLGEGGTLVITTGVLAVDVPDRPGALGRVAAKLARSNVNIDYAYGSRAGRSGRATLFLRVSDLRRGRRALGARS